MSWDYGRQARSCNGGEARGTGDSPVNPASLWHRRLACESSCLTGESPVPRLAGATPRCGV